MSKKQHPKKRKKKSRGHLRSKRSRDKAPLRPRLPPTVGSVDEYVDDVMQQTGMFDVMWFVAYLSDSPRDWADRLRGCLAARPVGSHQPCAFALMPPDSYVEGGDIAQDAVEEMRLWITHLVFAAGDAVRLLIDEHRLDRYGISPDSPLVSYGRQSLLTHSLLAEQPWNVPGSRPILSQQGRELLLRLRDLDDVELEQQEAGAKSDAKN